MNHILEFGLIFITAFFLGMAIYPVFIRLYTKKNILDRRESRKIHLKEVPTMGGVPLFIAFLVTTFIWSSFADLAENRYLIGSLVFILFVGLRDDFINLKPMVKLLSQLVPAFIIFYFTDARIVSLYGFISDAAFPIWLSLPVTLFTIIVITNSLNLIDGLDGLAGSISLIILVVLGIWFGLNEDYVFSMVLFAMAGSLVAFLQFNWQPARIFMGDTGALILGFFISVAIIRFINLNHALPTDSLYKFEGTIATALAILIIPLFDTLRVFTLRLIKKKSPFRADKNHIHHILLRIGMTHRQVALLLVGINLIFITLAVILRDVPDNILMPIILAVGLFLGLLLDYLFIKKVLIGQRKDSRSVMEIIRSSQKAS
jgi:UDP-GlcNAc:undecaprenyl-phosphate GlcNAc-1-phosphate transferase